MRLADLTRQIADAERRVEALRAERRRQVVHEFSNGRKLKAMAAEMGMTPVQAGRIHKAGLASLP